MLNMAAVRAKFLLVSRVPKGAFLLAFPNWEAAIIAHKFVKIL
jgi:hypothetical protein